MPSTFTDRIDGLSTSVAVKAPVRVATTANITLSGTQTIDGVAVVSGDRVLAKDQTDTTENGIYDVATSEWQRSKDFDGNRDTVNGTLMWDLNGSIFYQVVTANPITIGTSSIIFAIASSLSLAGFASVVSIAAMKALPSSSVSVGQSVEVTDNDRGGSFIVRSGSVAEDSGIFFEFDDQPASPGNSLYLERLFFGPVNVKWFNAKGDGSTNDTTAVQNVLQFLRDRGTSIALTLPELTVYQGGVTSWPFGAYVLDFDTFTIDDIMNLTFLGEGAGVEQNFGLPISRIVFTGTSSGYGLRVVHNGARGFRSRGIAFEYADSNFTGNLLEIENLASYAFRDCRFQHQVDGDRVYTANSLVNLIGDSKFAEWDYCSFDEADKGVITTAFGGNEPKATVFTSCIWNDLQTAQVNIPNGEQFGIVFRSCSFDPVNLRTTGTPVVNGLILGGSGWKVEDCIFGGATLDAVPSANFADLSGSGKFINNVTITNEVGIVIRGTVDFSSNKTSARVPLTLEAGSFTTGGGNIYSPANSPTDAVLISPNSGSVVLDIGPDIIESGFTNSYNVDQDGSSTNGRIRYSRGKDASTNGPLLVSEHVRLKAIDTEEFVKTANYTVLKEETGCTFNNTEAGGTVTFTLPTAVAGLEYTFYKQTNQQMNITAGAGDVFIKGAVSSDASLSNVSNELGAVVRIRAVSSVAWLVESISGTWT